VVSLSVVVRGGASAVPTGKSGLAALTARLMTEGTTARGALALAEAAESMGSVLEQSAARDSMRLGITVERRDLDGALALLAEVLLEPAFSATDLERVRKEWLDSLEAERQAPSRLASLVGLRLLLGPEIGAPVSGSRTDVKAIGRRDLTWFHRKTVAPENTAVVIVGDVSLADVRQGVVERFARFRPSPQVTSPGQRSPVSPAAARASDATKAPRVVLLDRPGAVQSSLFLAQPFPRRSEPGHEAREILNGLLGGLFTSRLNTNLREEHAYTYGVRSVDIATRSWGALAVMTSVRTDVTAAALAETLAELRAVRDGKGPRPVAEGEVERARLDLAQGLGASLAHTGDVAARLEDLFVQGLPADYHRKYPLLLNAITIAEVQREAERVTPEGLLVVVVGDRTAIEPQLTARGFTFELAPEAWID
jgi:zinc protease